MAEPIWNPYLRAELAARARRAPASPRRPGGPAPMRPKPSQRVWNPYVAADFNLPLGLPRCPPGYRWDAGFNRCVKR